jgi:hypothetical protein
LSGEVTRLTEELEQMKTRVADLSKDARKNQVNSSFGYKFGWLSIWLWLYLA